MCHLILILPFIALPILWLLPLSMGIPLSGIVLALAWTEQTTYLAIFSQSQATTSQGKT